MAQSAIAILFAILFLAACQTDMGEELANKSIFGIGTEVTVNYSEAVNLHISGTDHVIIIGSNIRELDISSINAQITVSNGVAIESIKFLGIENTLSLPKGFTTKLNQSGTGNSVTYR